jgi:threonine synthase
MRYISTRGQAPALNFEDVLLAGLASDGGLYVPENLPRFTQEEIASWAGLPYHELAFRVMRPFVTGSIPDADFKKILEETYSTSEQGVFAHSAVAPLRQLSGNEWVLELFHGPTLAFWSCSTARPWPSKTSPCNCSAVCSTTCWPSATSAW